MGLKVPNKKHTDRSYIFRFYTLIAVGLILVAAILDYAFGQYQEKQNSDIIDNSWVNNTFTLIEDQLSQVQIEERQSVVQNLKNNTGLDITLTENDYIVDSNERMLLNTNKVTEVENSNSEISYFYQSEKLDAALLIKVKQDKENSLTKFIPPLFYVSILALVGIWFRPLVRDLDLLTNSTKEFANDYRTPLAELNNTSALKDLSDSFSQMAIKIRELIQDHKDFTGALSHELRTPLARMKFGLAILDPDKPDEFAQEILSINKDILDLDNIITHILNHSKLDHLQTKVNYQSVPIQEWLESSIKQVKAHGVKFSIENKSFETIAEFDPYLMGLAISNLLENAKRYAKNRVTLSYKKTPTGKHIRD